MKTFVLGAGISSSAGLPLAKDLLTTVAEKTLDADDLRELHEFLAYLTPTFDPEVANYPDIEEFLTLLDVSESYSLFGPRESPFPRRRLLKLRRTFLDALVRYLWSGHRNVGQDHPICHLAMMLEPGDTVINFNYDLTLEQACQHHRIRWSYEPGSDLVTLLKPHGSIDWFYADELDSSGPGLTELFQDLTRYTALEYDETVLAAKLPVIVPPVATKLIESRDLRQIWNGVESAISTADDVYIIGYSLPDADRLTRFVLRRAIMSRGQPSGGLIWVINPDRAMRSRYSEWLSLDVNFVQQNFERWISALPDNLARPHKRASGVQRGAKVFARGKPKGRLPGSIREAMELMPRMFRPRRAEGINASIQYEFSGAEASRWWVWVKDGGCTVKKGVIGPPELTINAPSETWLQIMRRELDPAEAFMKGQYTFAGDMGVLMQLASWFGDYELR